MVSGSPAAEHRRCTASLNAELMTAATAHGSTMLKNFTHSAKKRAMVELDSDIRSTKGLRKKTANLHSQSVDLDRKP